MKDGKEYDTNSDKDKAQLFLINAHQARRIMGNTKKFVLLFLREGKKQGEGNKLDMKASLEGCSGEQRQKLQKLIESYRKVFQETRGLPTKREVEHRIQFFPKLPLPKNGLYREFVIEEGELNKKQQQLLE